MSINKIQGRAKKYDGTAIDYVSIFNWSDGKCITQVVPDALGNWEYTYGAELNVGLTYVADGCEPITHGAYNLAYQSSIPQDYILAYDFNGDMVDKSANKLDGVQVGVVNFEGGRKVGTQALRFTNGRVNSNAALPINSSVVTVSLWMKAESAAAAVLVELSQTPESFRAFTSVISNYDTFGGITLGYGRNASSQIIKSTNQSVTDNKWHHVVMQFGEELNGGATSLIKTYLDNNLLVLKTHATNSFYGVFDNKMLYIGKRDAYAHMLYTGLVQDIRVYNRSLTDIEITQLFNE